MSDRKILSCRLNVLIKEVKVNKIDAVRKFWLVIEKEGTPLIESIDGDEENVLVTFIYREKEPIENVIILGSVPGYQYSENIMEKLGDTDIWFKSYKIRKDIKFKYNFSLNYYMDKKDVYENSMVDSLNKNKVIFIKDEEDPESEESAHSIVYLPNVKPDKWTISNKDVSKGNIELNRFYSEILNDNRRVWVYTPKGYFNDEKPYGLLVLTDGFDYLNTLSAETVLNNIIDSKEIPPIMCVLIDTSINRVEELSCNEKFSQFLSKELMPWIYEKYNVSKEPKDAIIGGVSLGGLAATYIAFENSNIFGNVLSQSGSYWYNNEGLTKKYKDAQRLPINFYLNAGLLEDRPYDSEPIMMEVINNMRDTLLAKGYKVEYENFPSGHDHLGWAETLATGLIALIGINN